jgi:hypothetical protein
LAMSRMVTTRPGDPWPCLPTDLTDDNPASHAVSGFRPGRPDHTGPPNALFRLTAYDNPHTIA